MQHFVHAPDLCWNAKCDTLLLWCCAGGRVSNVLPTRPGCVSCSCCSRAHFSDFILCSAQHMVSSSHTAHAGKPWASAAAIIITMMQANPAGCTCCRAWPALVACPAVWTAMIDMTSQVCAVRCSVLQLFATSSLLRWLGMSAALGLAPAICLASLLGVVSCPLPWMVAVSEVCRKVFGYALLRPAREVCGSNSATLPCAAAHSRLLTKFHTH